MPFKPDPNLDPYDRSGWVVRSCAECGKEFKVRSYHRYARCEECRTGKKGRLKTRKPETNVCPRCGGWKHYNSKTCMTCYKKDLANTAFDNMPVAEALAVDELVEREKKRRRGMFKCYESTELRPYREGEKKEKKQAKAAAAVVVVPEKSVEEQLRELL